MLTIENDSHTHQTFANRWTGDTSYGEFPSLFLSPTIIKALSG